MKKFIILIISISLIIIAINFMDFKEKEISNINIKNFNLEYENFNKESLNGLEVATAINKAVSHNQGLEMPINEKGFYILDDEESVEIYVMMNTTETTYRMESIYGLGMDKFIKTFGTAEFKCTDVKYHEKTGRIASITFEAVEY